MEELQRSQMRGDVVCMCVWLGMGGAVGNNNQNIHGKTGLGGSRETKRGTELLHPNLICLVSAWKGPGGVMVPGRTPSRRDGRGQRWWC